MGDAAEARVPASPQKRDELPLKMLYLSGAKEASENCAEEHCAELRGVRPEARPVAALRVESDAGAERESRDREHDARRERRRRADRAANAARPRRDGEVKAEGKDLAR